VAGVDLVRLADRHGTPLYVYDAATIRSAYRAYARAFRAYRPVRISYSIKACPLIGVAAVLAAADADASAASIGEVLAARRAGFPASRIQLHGNAKTDDELRAAVRSGIGRIVIDGRDEIGALATLVAGRRIHQRVWLRVSPDVSADTHPHLRTGVRESKFGAPIATGDALAFARDIAATPGLRLVGIHAHIGTQIHEPDRYAELSERLVSFARDVASETGVRIREIGVGGGLATPLHPADRALPIEDYARAISGPIRAGDPRATIHVEPGRSLVGRSGVALYRVTGTKRVAGVRTFVSVDGGMGDNIRPALYGARYTALLAGRASASAEEDVAIAGKYCESGDILIGSVPLPTARRGEVLAIPGSGAYAVAMASNYNSHLRPAVVLIDRGHARVIRRREEHADLWRLERR
jgi:diaminopimelate decarboxylase